MVLGRTSELQPSPTDSSIRRTGDGLGRRVSQAAHSLEANPQDIELDSARFIFVWDRCDSYLHFDLSFQADCDRNISYTSSATDRKATMIYVQSAESATPNHAMQPTSVNKEHAAGALADLESRN